MVDDATVYFIYCIVYSSEEIIKQQYRDIVPESVLNHFLNIRNIYQNLKKKKITKIEKLILEPNLTKFYPNLLEFQSTIFEMFNWNSQYIKFYKQRDDKDFIDACIKKKINIFSHLSDENKSDENVAESFIKLNPYNITYCTEKLVNDKKFIKKMIELNPIIFENLPMTNQMKNEKDIINLAVEKRAENFFYVGDEFKKTKEYFDLVKKNIASKPMLIRVIDMKNFDVYLELVDYAISLNVDDNVLRYTNRDLMQSENFIDQVLLKNPKYLKHMPYESLNNPELMIKVFSVIKDIDGKTLFFNNLKLTFLITDKAFLEKLKQIDNSIDNIDVYKDMMSKALNRKDFIIQNITYHPEVIKTFDGDLNNEANLNELKELVKKGVSENSNVFEHAFNKFGKQLGDDFLKSLILLNENLFRHIKLSDMFRNNSNFMLLLYKKIKLCEKVDIKSYQEDYFNYMGDSLKNDFSFLSELRKQNNEIYKLDSYINIIQNYLNKTINDVKDENASEFIYKYISTTGLSLTEFINEGVSKNKKILAYVGDDYERNVDIDAIIKRMVYADIDLLEYINENLRNDISVMDLVYYKIIKGEIYMKNGTLDDNRNYYFKNLGNILKVDKHFLEMLSEYDSDLVEFDTYKNLINLSINRDELFKSYIEQYPYIIKNYYDLPKDKFLEKVLYGIEKNEMVFLYILNPINEWGNKKNENIREILLKYPNLLKYGKFIKDIEQIVCIDEDSTKNFFNVFKTIPNYNNHERKMFLHYFNDYLEKNKGVLEYIGEQDPDIKNVDKFKEILKIAST